MVILAAGGALVVDASALRLLFGGSECGASADRFRLAILALRRDGGGEGLVASILLLFLTTSESGGPACRFVPAISALRRGDGREVPSTSAPGRRWAWPVLLGLL